jgi:single-stranded-DNA-specific exonuclease
MLKPERISLRATHLPNAQRLAEHLGVSITLASLLEQRGLTTPEQAHGFLNDGDETAHDPFLMRDMAIAVRLLRHEIDQGGEIFIHGDYDVDGICSTVLLYEALREVGAVVSYHVPDRFSEGYGVSLQAVQASTARMLLTCDCGSSSHAAIAQAKAQGMVVVLTDHHHLPSELPCPDAFLNPQLSDCHYPFKPLCGAGVAYKLMCALFADMGRPVPTHLLDLVATATIADVVPLVGENRALVRSGMLLLRQLLRPGMRALAEVANLVNGSWGSFAVGFGLGPRLNAAGRLEHARLGVELLLETDPQAAQMKALHLEELNRHRREHEKTIRQEVEARLLASPELLEFGVVVEAGDDWHQGVVGITASRVVDRFGLPSLIMGRVGDLVKGSARSPENVDIFQAMQKCADVFLKFGGHSRAAGFTLEASRVDELRERLSLAVAELRGGPVPLAIDLQIDLSEATLELVRELSLLEPLGEGNREPLFLARRVRLDQLRAIGQGGEHLRFQAVQNGRRRKAVAFRQGEDHPHLEPQRLYYDIVFRIQEENWDGQSSCQIMVEGLLEPAPVALTVLRGGGCLPEPEEPGTPYLLDARHVLDRKGYVKTMLERNPNCALMVQTQTQLAKVRESLPSGAGLFRYQESVPVTADVLLLFPPAELQSVRHPDLWRSRRIHFLFGDHELQLEQQRLELATLDRARMQAIWKMMTRNASQGRLGEQEWRKTEQDIRSLPASREALLTAVKVLEELGLAMCEPHGIRLSQQSGRKLEESVRFVEQGQRMVRFSHMCQVLQERNLSLAGLQALG